MRTVYLDLSAGTTPVRSPLAPAALQVVYLGGPTVVLEIGGLRFMTDPTLDPAGGIYPVDATHQYTKLSGPALPQVDAIDVVLLSHDQHHDNLDKRGRELLQRVKATFTTPAGAARLQGTSQGLAPWERALVRTPSGEDITITATPARHGPAGFEQTAGDVIGFVVSVQGPHPVEVYLTGDTVYYEGIAEVAKRFHPQYVFAFAGAAQPRGPFNVTMSTNDLLDTAAAFPQAIIIPLHYEGWSHYTQAGETLKQAFTALGRKEQLKLLVAGVPQTLSG